MASSLTYFQGRELAIVTKHKKEEAIIPAFESILGLSCRVESRIDTDQLGTFTGEIPRDLDHISAARKKCLLALDFEDCDLVLSSEGSFGPHPSLFFISSGFEVLYLIDKRNNWELKEFILSTDTNFASAELRNESELIQFAKKAGFPEHGLILKVTEKSRNIFLKDFSSFDDLLTAFGCMNVESNSIIVETDMRAMRNPTRMGVINLLAKKMANRLLNFCEKCETPGFGFDRIVSGMPCSNCGNATRQALQEIHSCVNCKHEKIISLIETKGFADPQICEFCNP